MSDNSTPGIDRPNSSSSNPPVRIPKRIDVPFMSRQKQFAILAHPAQERLARKLVEFNRERFTFHPTKWGKFPDGTDNIEMGGMHPVNQIWGENILFLIRGENILFLASFHNNDATLSQFH
ncbi:hypothetical protein T484DRAFT_1787303, partial [Baffinella frigidus]